MGDLKADTPLEPSWELFAERLAELGGHTLHIKERPLGPAILRHLDDLGIPARHAVLDDDAAELSELSTTADVWTADVGITLADVAVAETGSLLLAAGPGRGRMNSLAPPTHVAIVDYSAVESSLEGAFDRLSDRTSVLITGPSRTADIEGVLVRGVHGPKELIVVVVNTSAYRQEASE
jgi:L-lactate dehydrogenase complex protein LldG